MEVKKNFIKREIAGEHILVPTGETSLTFNGLITMNELGAFIWEHLKNVKDEEEMVKLIMEEYEASEVAVQKDVSEFLEKLKKAEII